MIQLKVSSDERDIRLDKFLRDHFPHLPRGIIFKALRKKDILINGRRVSDNQVLKGGDEIIAFIPAQYLTVPKVTPVEMVDILYEDENILIVNKPAGLSVHPDRKSQEDTLIQRVSRYLADKGEAAPDSTLPALCHRLDHHTGGLVVIARTAAARQFMLQMIKERQIRKYYLCLVKGIPDPEAGEAIHYFSKDALHSRVMVADQPGKDRLTAVTRYKTLRSGGQISLLEVELHTGRTHQIRAHLAYLGHPILGDDKYGDRTLNRLYRVKTQQLQAYKITFSFPAVGPFAYLAGRTFQLTPMPYVNLDLNQIPLRILDR